MARTEYVYRHDPIQHNYRITFDDGSDIVIIKEVSFEDAIILAKKKYPKKSWVLTIEE